MGDAESRRILVVEDEPLVAMLLEDILLDLGFDVIGPALRLERALELARSETVDAAILDVNLGGDRSYAVAETLGRRDIPYAFATGYGSPGMTGSVDVPVLRKPFERDSVRRVVAELFGAP